MNTIRIGVGAALIAGFCLPSSTSATLTANDLSGNTGTANLTYSRLSIQMGAQWMDVEEEAEIQVTPDWNESSTKWIVEGTFTVPKATAITGCMLWNDDTLLMGKLRGKSQAKEIFDSLVPPRQPAWARDPLLIEQLDDTTYGLHLYPFTTDGSRRFRLRYLVPLLPGTESVSIKPLLAKTVNGTLPAQFRLKVKGAVVGAKVQQAGLSWPLTLPSNDLIDLGPSDDVRLVWPTGPAGDATRALRSHIDSGAWKGDFVLYTGRLPDSILSKVALRSETVVLWKWIQPKSFLEYWGDGRYRSPSKYGWMSVNQAMSIRDIASRLTSSGNRVGLIVDRSLDDSLIKFPLSDSSSADYRQMDHWLAGITESYLISSTASPTGGAIPGALANLDISKSRQGFKTDITEAATLFSKDSGIIRHVLIVTVGPGESTDYLEPVDTTIIPQHFSISSSQLLVTKSHFVQSVGYVEDPPSPAQWPGVDLGGLVQARKGGREILRPWSGIDLPRSRDSLAGKLSFQSGSGRISRNIVVRRAPDGSMVASLNVHGTDVSKSVTWSLFDENGNTLKSWDATPEWTIADGDSVVPRLWAKSDAPLSPVFQDKELAPLFGFVDPFYSLLATPSDSVGKNRQVALRDSGVPFLSSAEIFARQGYGGENTGIEGRASMTRSGLKVAFDPSSRTIRIDLEGVSAQSIEIRDLRGKLLASWTKDQLAGLESLSWRIPSNATKGMLLVSARTGAGIVSAKIFAN